MKRYPGYTVLFEPMKTGPVTTKNRVNQVLQCTGIAWQRPKALKA